MNYLTHNLEVFFNYFKLILYVTKNDLDMIKGSSSKGSIIIIIKNTDYNYSCVLVAYSVHASIQHPPAVPAK